MPQIYDMGLTALLPLRKKTCWGFFRPKNPTASAGFEPANLGTKGQNANSRPPKPLVCKYNQIYFVNERFHNNTQTWTLLSVSCSCALNLLNISAHHSLHSVRPFPHSLLYSSQHNKALMYTVLSVSCSSALNSLSITAVTLHIP